MSADGPLSADEKAAAALTQLAEQDERLAALEAVIAAMQAEEPGGTGKAYRPKPAPRWWLLDGAERTEALLPLQAWVDQVYRPLYGHLAARLPSCWTKHPLCLILLDWLSELWQVLYVRPGRTAGILVSQAEWQTRLLPAAADQMHQDGTGCAHRQGGRP